MKTFAREADGGGADFGVQLGEQMFAVTV